MSIRPARLTALGCISVLLGLIFISFLSDQTPVDSPELQESNLKKLMPIWNLRARLVALNADDKPIEFPMLKSEYRVDIRGDMATIRLRQTFKNPGDSPLNATYEFPLHEDSAVFAMTMRSGDARIRAEIRRKKEAKQIFEAAKNDGKAAALLEQERPNLFTQSIANLMPGNTVEIELSYVQPLAKFDGRYQLDLPLVAGPRYQPDDMSGNFLVASADGTHDAFDHQSPSPSVAAESAMPETLDSERVSIEIRIDGGVPVHQIESPSHQLFSQQLAPNIWEVELDEGLAIPNKHFSMTYKLGGKDTNAGLVSYYDKNAKLGYFGLLIAPPTDLKAEADEILPREMVFVIDASGSMSGPPMEANKAYMRHALQNLRPSDTFRLIEFNQTPNEYSRAPIAATPANIAEARAYVESMEANGGTDIESAIDRALSPKVAPGHLRLVTFLTDGYVVNEFETLRTLNEKRGEARLFAIGVSAISNRYLLSKMGRMGNGFSTFIDPSEDVRSQAVAIAQRLQSPVLRDIRIDWGGFLPSDTWSGQIPDLFAGESVRLLGAFKNSGTYQLIVHGISGRGPVSFPLEITVSEDAADGKAVELAWARARIDGYMADLLSPEDTRESDLSDDQIRDLVTSLGLEHSLVSQWTSFVAVSEEVVNPHANAEDTWGTSAQALVAPAQETIVEGAPVYQQIQNAYAPSASGTPEPATWAGLLLAAIALLFAMWGPRRSRLTPRAR